MDVTITNAGGRIEIVDLRNNLTNNYNVLKDGLRLFNLGNIVRITFINRRNIEINYNEVELINGATSVFPVSGVDFLNELNIILGDFGAGGGGTVGTLQQVTDLGNSTDNDISFTNAGLLFDNGAKFKKGTTDGGLGGVKGVAQICSIDYELKWEAGRLYVMEQNGFTIREVRYTFTSIPNVNDDFTKGFVVGSRWVLDNGNLYNCTDSTTGAAVWSLETLGGGDMYKSVYDTDNDGVVDKSETVQIIVRNSTGVTLTKGQIVYLSGATGNRPNAVLAQANTEATSSKTIGWVFANINNNSDGYVCISGSQHDLDTSALTAGDALWLSPTVAGGITSTLPVQPNHAVFIGYCARSHPTQGRIVFKIQNGYELQELHNVLITSVANNEGLFYESSTSLWKNKTIATALGFTPENSANKSTSVTTDSSSNIKFPSVKSVYDWAVGAFTTTAAVASQITTALTGYATQTWVNTQGFLTAITSGQITTALGFTPVTNARTLSGTKSISGGGDLTANRTLELVNDETSPTARKFYSTNGSASKGWRTIDKLDLPSVVSVGSIPYVQNEYIGFSGANAIVKVPGSNRIFVANTTTGNVICYDTQTSEVLSTTSVTGASGLVFVAQTGQVWAFSGVNVINRFTASTGVSLGSTTVTNLTAGCRGVYDDSNVTGNVYAYNGPTMNVINHSTYARTGVTISAGASNTFELTLVTSGPQAGLLIGTVNIGIFGFNKSTNTLAFAPISGAANTARSIKYIPSINRIVAVSGSRILFYETTTSTTLTLMNSLQNTLNANYVDFDETENYLFVLNGFGSTNFLKLSVFDLTTLLSIKTMLLTLITDNAVGYIAPDKSNKTLYITGNTTNGIINKVIYA